MSARCWRRLVRKWESIQVELHGGYSIERAYSLHLFQGATSLARAVTGVALTPVPCLFAALSLELIPLEAPERGIRHSHMFWLRAFLGDWMLTYAILVQCHLFIIALPMTSTQMVCVSLVNALGSMLWAFGLACWIGFPVPFTIILSAPCVCIIMAIALNVVWGKYFREMPALKKELQFYGLVLATQLAFTYIYPVYTYGFNTSTGLAQAAFALLLPVMKIVAKNWMSYLMHEKPDFKPEFVVFHVEVFHALFLATCLQNSTSYSSLVVLMGVDFGSACISLRDVDLVLDSIHEVVRNKAHSQFGPHAALTTDAHTPHHTKKTSVEAWRSLHYLDAVIFLLEHDQGLLQHPSINRHSTHSQLPRVVRLLSSTHFGQQKVKDTKPGPSTLQRSKTNQVFPEPSEKKHDDQQISKHEKIQQQRAPHPTQPMTSLYEPDPALSHLTANLTEEHRHLLLSMSNSSRLEFVQQILHILYMTEFLLLVEFIEVVVPVVYSIYLGFAFYLPNRAFYEHLQGIDTAELRQRIGNVLLYGSLEACSLAFLSVMLQRKLRFSSLYQLAFVLETQWQQVQSKLVFWVLFALQFPLTHFGVDFSFQFAWLKTSVPAS